MCKTFFFENLLAKSITFFWPSGVFCYPFKISRKGEKRWLRIKSRFNSFIASFSSWVHFLSPGLPRRLLLKKTGDVMNCALSFLRLLCHPWRTFPHTFAFFFFFILSFQADGKRETGKNKGTFSQKSSSEKSPVFPRPYSSVPHFWRRGYAFRIMWRELPVKRAPFVADQWTKTAVLSGPQWQEKMSFESKIVILRPTAWHETIS